MWRLISTIVIFQYHSTLGKLVGEHVCLTEESYPANVTEYRLRNATFRNYKWCMNVPPRCSYYTVKTINESRIVEKILTRTAEKCCEGYTEENEKCVTKCKQECKNGRCINGTCTCSSGFKGNTCDVGCDQGTWGPNCLNICDCEENTCDPINGTCVLSQTTLTSLPKPSMPSYISINDSESKISTSASSTSTEISSITDKSSDAIVTNTSSTASTPTDVSINVTKDDKLTGNPSTTPSSRKGTNLHGASTTKSIQHIPESTTSSYQQKQSTSSSLKVSIKTSLFQSTPDYTTSSRPAQKHTDFSQSVSSKLNITEVSSTEFDPTEKASVQTQPNFIDTTATITKTSPLTTPRSTTTDISSNKSIIVKQSATKASNEINNELGTKSTYSLVNNISEFSSTESLSKSSVKTYSNEITDSLYKAEGHMNITKTTPLMTSSPSTESTIAHSMSTSTQRHAEDQLNKPTAVATNFAESMSNKTKEVNLDGMLKEYTVPVEVKYEIPAQKKEMASTHENYAEEKNYLTLEDRGYINKHVSSDSEYFVNSFTAAAVIVLVVAVLVMMFLGWNSWKGKKALESRDANRKDAAVYTTSIFHTPLPDPPIIENPTYLLTTIDCKKCNTETLLLKARPAYPIHRMSQMGGGVTSSPSGIPNMSCLVTELREYVYDHPPSTGSYRAASAVDSSDVSGSYIATEIAEPVYDEIPLRNGIAVGHGANAEANTSLYVNTVGRTKF